MRKIWKQLISISMSLIMALGSNVVMTQTAYADEETGTETKQEIVYGDDVAYDPNTGHSYEFVNSSVNYSTAKKEAKNKGGYLICISSKEENNIVVHYLEKLNQGDTRMWIGLERNQNDISKFKWIDGSELTYTNWEKGEPSTLSETRVEVYFEGTWNDCYGSLDRPYIIEYDKCSHPEEKEIVENRTITDCSIGGFTGKVTCGVCGEILDEGIMVEPGNHAEAVIDKKTFIEATCKSKGFSGNKICPLCKKVLEEGKETDIVDHKKEDEPENYTENTCYVDGYTGDYNCKWCGEKVQEGSIIAKKSHEYKDDVCVNCGRVNNAVYGKEYSMKTTAQNPFQVFQFKVDEDGYYAITCSNKTDWDSYGYLFEEESFNDEIIRNGIKKLENNNRVRLEGCKKKNDDGGQESAPKIIGNLKKNHTYYFVVGPFSDEYGEYTISWECAHSRKKFVNRTIKSCEEGGYTGDLQCKDCGKTISEGQQIEPQSDHSYSERYTIGKTCTNYEKIVSECEYCGYVHKEINEKKGLGEHVFVKVNHKEPTCTEEGYSYDLKCSECGEINNDGNQEAGQTIPSIHSNLSGSNIIKYYNESNATCFKAGYTGDTICLICNEVLEKGSESPQLEHNYVDDKCTNCGLTKNQIQELKDNCFEINSFEDLLMYLQMGSLGINGKLNADIKFPDNYKDDDNILNGASLLNSKLDGNNHTISNVNIEGIPCRLYDSIGNSTLKNLKIEVQGECEQSIYYLTEYAYYSTIENCTFEGNVKASRSDVAAIQTIDTCTISKCINNVDCVNFGDAYVAGLAIKANNSNITDCENNGDFSVNDSYIAGLVHTASNCHIENCINTGNITDAYEAAGIVASINNSEIKNCTNKGDITNAEGAVGICVSANNTKVEECSNYGNIIDNEYVASGIVGIILQAQIINCTNYGKIKANNCAAGICYSNSRDDEGYYDQKEIIQGCTNNGEITSTDLAAGIVSIIYNCNIDNCTNSGDVQAGSLGGGILAVTANSSISNCINNGSVDGYEYVGGICGSSDDDVTFEKVYNSGKVTEEAFKSKGITNGTGNEVIKDSEENHEHKYSEVVEMTPSTLTENGVIKEKCSCGYINKRTISHPNELIISNDKFEATGEKIAPTVTVVDVENNPIDQKYYTVTYRDKAIGKTVDEVKAVGTYEVVITFSDLYEGEMTKEFTVVEKTTEPATSDVTTGNNETSTPDSTTGDQEVSTPDSTTGDQEVSTNDTTGDDVETSTSETTAGDVETTTPKTTTGDKVTTTGNKPTTKVKKLGKVKKVSVKKLSRKKISVKWKKIKGVKGYQVRYATNKKMKKAKIKTIAKNKASFTLKKLKGKKYFIQVRAYKIGKSNKKVKGKWSSVKKVKMKK